MCIRDRYMGDVYIFQNFIDHMVEYFETKGFYASKYPTAAAEIREIDEILNRKPDNSCFLTKLENSNEIILYEEDDVEEIPYSPSLERSPHRDSYSNINHERIVENIRLPHLDQSFEQVQDIQPANVPASTFGVDATNLVNANQATKSKKKKKKNKKKNAAASTTNNQLTDPQVLEVENSLEETDKDLSAETAAATDILLKINYESEHTVLMLKKCTKNHSSCRTKQRIHAREIGRRDLAIREAIGDGLQSQPAEQDQAQYL
eukprot:TRINITY_DN9088_c0_g1_i8.p1 TRINITY_DN9088_c0_g1~~TRINITY_DN9088_c0_g1_i8.p1  ORF type:complete len:262 (-),score=44.30 TRINITY_DN9088_c0_g1_i8:279-1064(-)